MEPKAALISRKKSTSVKLAKNAKILKTIIKALQEKKGEKIVSLDLRKIHESVADFFIICEATSTTQLKALAGIVEDKVKKECGENPFQHEGFGAVHWIIIDYINVVVHIMLPETRKFYGLEELWNDAPLTEYNEG